MTCRTEVCASVSVCGIKCILCLYIYVSVLYLSLCRGSCACVQGMFTSMHRICNRASVRKGLEMGLGKDAMNIYVCLCVWVGNAGVWRGWKINRKETHFPSLLLQQCRDSINEPGLRFPGNAYEWEQVGNRGDSAKGGIAGCHGNAMNRERTSKVKVVGDLWCLHQGPQSP